MKTPDPAKNATVVAQIAVLSCMTVGGLREKWRELHDGEEPRSWNKQWLFRRLAWRVQEIAYGGLSDRAKARLDELARDADLRVRPPKGWDPLTAGRPAPTPPAPRRDPRLPRPGTTLSRQYHGRGIRVSVLEDGFEWEGRRFDSLSSVAKAVTGQKWNGRLFFGLTRRKKA